MGELLFGGGLRQGGSQRKKSELLIAERAKVGEAFETFFGSNHLCEGGPMPSRIRVTSEKPKGISPGPTLAPQNVPLNSSRSFALVKMASLWKVSPTKSNLGARGGQSGISKRSGVRAFLCSSIRCCAWDHWPPLRLVLKVRIKIFCGCQKHQRLFCRWEISQIGGYIYIFNIF